MKQMSEQPPTSSPAVRARLIFDPDELHYILGLNIHYSRAV